MSDESVMRRWFQFELGKMLDHFVPVPRPLHDLLRAPKPTAPTRSGQPHVFDLEALQRLDRQLPPLLRVTARLPFTFHIDHENPGDAYTSDATTNECLEALGASKALRDGRAWLSTPLARDFARKYPSLTQFVLH